MISLKIVFRRPTDSGDKGNREKATLPKSNVKFLSLLDNLTVRSILYDLELSFKNAEIGSANNEQRSRRDNRFITAEIVT